MLKKVENRRKMSRKCAAGLENAYGYLGTCSGACGRLTEAENAWKHVVYVEEMGKWFEMRVGGQK